MAPSNEFDRQVDELAVKYATVAAGLTALVSGASPAMSARIRTEAQRLLTALLGASIAWINVTVPMVYRSGVQGSLRAIGGSSQEDLRAQADEAMRSREHKAAMEALAELLRDDLYGATEGMGRDVNRTLNGIRQRAVSEALAKGAPLEGVPAFSQEMKQGGISFKDKSGRKWMPEAYAQMVLRTHVATIQNAGHINKAIEMGSRHVKVFDGGPGDVDDPCKKANGQVWHISRAISEPLEHPNCRRSFAALDPGNSRRLEKEGVAT